MDSILAGSLFLNPFCQMSYLVYSDHLYLSFTISITTLSFFFCHYFSGFSPLSYVGYGDIC